MLSLSHEILNTLLQAVHTILHIGASRCHIQSQETIPVRSILSSRCQIESTVLTDKFIHRIRIRRQCRDIQPHQIGCFRFHNLDLWNPPGNIFGYILLVALNILPKLIQPFLTVSESCHSRTYGKRVRFRHLVRVESSPHLMM